MKSLKLTQKHIEYIQSCFENGGVLGRCLLEKVVITLGLEVEILTDSEIPIDYDFNWGGHFIGGRRLLQQRVVRHLAAEKDHLCVFYAIDPKKGDPLIGNNGSKYLFNSDDVYYVAIHGDSDRKVEQTIRDSDFMFFFGMASKCNQVHTMMDASELTNCEIQQIVEQVFCVFLGVFDGEAFIVIDMEKNRQGHRSAPRTDNERTEIHGN